MKNARKNHPRLFVEELFKNRKPNLKIDHKVENARFSRLSKPFTDIHRRDLYFTNTILA